MAIETSLILTSILSVAFIAFLIKFFNWVWFKPKKIEKFLREQGLKGSSYRFLLGDLGDLTRVIKQEETRPINFDDDIPSHILPYYHQAISKYGKNSFLWFGPTPTMNIAEPELLKEILTKRDIFHKLHPDPIGETIVGGLLFLEDDKWSKHRKIINPTFHMEKLKNMVPEFCLSCSDMIDAWDKVVSGNDEKSLEFDIWPYLENLAGDVISRTAFGSSYEEGKRVFELQNEQIKLALDLLPLIFVPGWSNIPTKANKQIKALQQEIRSLLRTIIDKRKKEMERGETIQGDLLSTLMESNMGEIEQDGDKTKGMSIEEVIEECKLFYFAGSETTSLLILWTLVMLSKHQEWQTLVRDEVMQVFGKGQPTFDGLNHLKIMNIIFLEVMRLYPPVPLTSRSPNKTVKIGSITIPKGTNLMLLIGILHYDRDIWGEDVSEFKPERFAKGVSSAVKNPFSYIPFGGGPRICIGQNLAMIEAKVAMVMILQRFSFELGSSYVHAPFPVLTLRPQRGASMLLRKL